MRNVLVSGGTRGVGLAIARKLATDGHRVFALGRKESDALVAATADFPSGVMNFVPFDLANIDMIPDLIREMKAEHGPLYGLVNNAALGTDGLLSNMHNSDIEKLVKLNTISPIVLTKYCVRSMMTSGTAREQIRLCSTIWPGFFLSMTSATIAVVNEPDTSCPLSSTRNTRSASPSNARPTSAPVARTRACRSTRFSGWMGSAGWFGKVPSSSP